MDSKTPEKSLKKILNKVDFQTDIKPPPIPSDNRSQR